MEVRPSFSPPRRDLRPLGADPGATEVYSQRLDILNLKYERLLETLSQRLKTAIEVNGADGLVSTHFFYITSKILRQNRTREDDINVRLRQDRMMAIGILRLLR